MVAAVLPVGMLLVVGCSRPDSAPAPQDPETSTPSNVHATDTTSTFLAGTLSTTPRGVTSTVKDSSPRTTSPRTTAPANALASAPTTAETSATMAPSSTVAPQTSVARAISTTTHPPSPTTTFRPGSIVLTIPKGTRARLDRGEDVSDVLPLTLDLKVGQYIYLVNNDDYFYSYGPLNVMPLDTTPWFFSVPGTTVGFCDIAKASVTFRVSA